MSTSARKSSRANGEVVRQRRLPALGGFNLTFLGLEVRRLARNRRTVILSLVVPVVFFLLFSQRRKINPTGSAQIEATVMVGLAVYGGMLAASAGGAMVSIERALGWSRQLRLTPLRPPAYVAIKLLVAMILGLVSVTVTFTAGVISGVNLSPLVLIECGVLAWLGALVFASFGLFMGYLLPSENAMQLIAPILAAFAFLGGLLVPLSLLGDTFENIGPWTPAYGVAAIARFPIAGGSFDPTWLLNAAVWTFVFASGAMILFRRDTQRT